MAPDPTELRATCPKCAHELWKQRDGEWTLRNRILKLKGDQLVARCPSCSTEVSIPFLRLASPRRRLALAIRVDNPSTT